LKTSTATFQACVWLAFFGASFACGGPGSGDAPAADAAPSAADAAPSDAAHAADAALSAADATPSGDAAPVNTTFRAPLATGPDPYVVFADGFYYLATTGDRSLHMRKSASLAGLLAAPAVTVWAADDPSRGQHMWAPSFARFGDHWYLYFAADDGVDDHHRIHVVESEGTDPLGPYHYKNRLVAAGAEEVWAIDQEILRQDHGLYLLWSGAGAEGHNLIYVAPMSNPWTVSGARTYLPAAGGCPEVREGPSVLQHAGTSFVIYSTCDTGKPDYQLWMMSLPTSADPTVPSSWTQHAGAVLARNDAEGVWGPGHNGFFKSPDGSEDWLVYHAKNTTQFTYSRRTTRALRIRWNADGTPDFGHPPALGYTLDLPAGDPGGGPYWINDSGTSSGQGSVAYDGAWTAYPSCGVQCFWGDDHGSSAIDASATFTFAGTQLALLSVSDAGNGIAGVSVDGGPETMVDLYASIRQGEQLQYLSPHLAAGVHHVRVRVTGQKNAASSGVAVSIDRAEAYTQ
jgi:GH43 family beta-xylosidase